MQQNDIQTVTKKTIQSENSIFELFSGQIQYYFSYLIVEKKVEASK